MSNAAILALNSRVLANTLTAADQAALSEALLAIAPTFGTPDETGVIPFSDEGEARDWIAALYTIQAGGAGGPLMFTRVVTHNPETSLTAPFQPGTGGKVLLVADVTPQSSGLLLVNVNVSVIEDATGVPAVAIIFVPNLTAITGGTLIAPGLTEEPTSTTPAFNDVSAVGVWAYEAPSFNDGSSAHVALLVTAGVPVQATAGQRCGIIVLGRDTGTQNWTAIGASMSVVEQL